MRSAPPPTPFRRKAIKLVALTGYGQPEDKARARTAGFIAHFVKPVDFAQLLAAVLPLAMPIEAGQPQAG